VDVDELANIQETNEGIRCLNSLIAECRKLVGAFNHNGDLKRELRHQQEELDYETRIKLRSETNVRYG